MASLLNSRLTSRKSALKALFSFTLSGHHLRRYVTYPERYYWELDIPTSVDWRRRNAVTEVRDQGGYNTSWAIAAAGAIEGYNKIRTGSLVELSAQQIVDWNAEVRGSLDLAFRYVMEAGGLHYEEDYPYVGAPQTCYTHLLSNCPVVDVLSFESVSPYEESILKMVAKRPVCATLFAGKDYCFYGYNGGILTHNFMKSEPDQSLSLYVLIVGYGRYCGTDVWLVKNSWGPNWGVNGYAYIQRNTGVEGGVYGIYQDVYAPSSFKMVP